MKYLPTTNPIHVQYESSSEEMRQRFEKHGEIKTFFDLIKTRGMVFVTFVSDCSLSILPALKLMRAWSV
jgi:hypothetical protein